MLYLNPREFRFGPVELLRIQLRRIARSSSNLRKAYRLVFLSRYLRRQFRAG
jgi:hypothetical protein